MQTSTPVPPDVQARIDELAVPDNFGAAVFQLVKLDERLSNEESYRLSANLDVVIIIAKRMAASMLKGVLKYPDGPAAADRTPEEWYEYGIDEAIDTVLTFGLMRQSMPEQAIDLDDYGIRLIDAEKFEQMYLSGEKSGKAYVGMGDKCGCGGKTCICDETLEEKRARLDQAAVDDANKPWVRPAAMGGPLEDVPPYVSQNIEADPDPQNFRTELPELIKASGCGCEDMCCYEHGDHTDKETDNA